MLKIPYAFSFSLLIGVSNMIPYFGVIIVMVPIVIITLSFSTIKTLELVIFIVL